jgi:hypothetical protein
VVICAADSIEGINHIDIRNALPMAMWPLSSPSIVLNEVEGSGGIISGEALVERAAATGTVARI